MNVERLFHDKTELRDIEDGIMAMEFFNALSKENKAILGLHLNGYNQTEIGRLVGAGRTTICVKLMYIKDALTKHYRDERKVSAKRQLNVRFRQ